MYLYGYLKVTEIYPLLYDKLTLEVIGEHKKKHAD